MSDYLKFIQQHSETSKNGFEVLDKELHFQKINLMEMIETYGTPLKFTYLPLVSSKIQYMKLLFQQAIAAVEYKGKHHYCYCTKSSHFSYILQEALQNDIGLEISSAFDIPLIQSLLKTGQLKKDTLIICNGFKTEGYKQGIAALMKEGFESIVPVIDNKEEFNFYADQISKPLHIGLRIAAEDRPSSQFYTSRLGIRKEEIVDFYKQKIAVSKHIRMTTLHFFIDSGISDRPFYWEELEKHVGLYCRLKAINPYLTTLDIGGGMPFKDDFEFDFDYPGFVNQLMSRIKNICERFEIPEPDLITEFGKYTVAEASGIIYKVLGRKQQNNKEKWLMLDGSFITDLPDTWATGQKYLLLPINNLDAKQEQVYLGGMTCDGDDYYNMGANQSRLFMPGTRKTQYVGFFHTGAYQEVLSGYGGIHHCLLPSPKHLVISKNGNETLNFNVFAEEQNSKQALKILGYN